MATMNDKQLALSFLRQLRKLGYACSGCPGRSGKEWGNLQAPSTLQVWHFNQAQLFAKMQELRGPVYVRLLDAVVQLCAEQPIY